MSGFNFGAGAGGLSSTVTAGGGFGAFGAAAGASSNPAGTGGFTLGNMASVAPTIGAGTTTTTTSSLGLGGGLFGQAKPATGFSFGGAPTGTAATSTVTGLTLGAPATTAAATTGFSLGFSKPAASAGPFSLPAAGGGLSLGSTLTSAMPAGSTGFSLSLGSTPASSTALTGLSLGSTGLGSSLFASSAATGLGQGFGQGLGQSSVGLGLTLAAPAATTSQGLGGVDFTNSSEKRSDKSSGARPEDSKALKDENLPPVICQDVDNFQKFVKEQKQVQEEISRMSSKAMQKVQDDIKSLKQLLSVSASGLQRNSQAIDKLKIETAQELKNAEISLRTQKIPPGLQHENTAPSDYFRVLVAQFEVQLQLYRQQIEELENHLTAQASSSHITPQDLSLALQKLYQTFVALAAQLQSAHENVKILKHQYLDYRKVILEDSTDVFESKRAATKKYRAAPRVTTGPTPFSSIPNAAAIAMAATLTQQQQPATGAQPSLGASFGAPFGSGMGTGLQSSGLGSTILGAFGSAPGFGSGAAGSSTFGFGSASKPSGSLSAGFGSSGTTSGFNFSTPGITASAGLTFGVSNPPAAGFGTGGQLLQLKKPPVGNKRGKR
ncbi:nucleoporin p58/p45-like isoform X1 [Acipenser oxyrinchus oxyrinchus]|uniref:Nucleoporin p58/p45-like isoform X1 n=1 Tax=Acipenser oxyrinchus oxyrinchus TaxID=40147 RepID=A0AAD8G604_ACIOX|nr:nucleoporin p58/p45-like isoform X1 [Acipenser oxyrinchus oxyrinchus]